MCAWGPFIDYMCQGALESMCCSHKVYKLIWLVVAWDLNVFARMVAMGWYITVLFVV
jgi:hypothetical protein